MGGTGGVSYAGIAGIACRRSQEMNKYILLALIVFAVLIGVLGIFIAYNWSEIAFLYFGVVR
jgi:uncharacterized membrane protein